MTEQSPVSFELRVGEKGQLARNGGDCDSGRFSEENERACLAYMARVHVAKSGYAHVSALTKDKSGVWRGTVVKKGSDVHVGLDLKGNVSNEE